MVDALYDFTEGYMW